MLPSVRLLTWHLTSVVASLVSGVEFGHCSLKSFGQPPLQYVGSLVRESQHFEAAEKMNSLPHVRLHLSLADSPTLHEGTCPPEDTPSAEMLHWVWNTFSERVLNGKRVPSNKPFLIDAYRSCASSYRSDTFMAFLSTSRWTLEYIETGHKLLLAHSFVITFQTHLILHFDFLFPSLCGLSM
jgi:hypothetical protein